MYDFLIIGHGLAGATLAQTLISRGYNLKVIDKAELSSCSRIAAGIINPVAIRRSSMSWRADEFIPFLENYYPALEHKLGIKFYHPTRMLKPYGSQEDRDQWQSAKHTGPLSQFLAEKDVFCDAPVINPFGCLEILHTGWLDTSVYLEACRKDLGDSYTTEQFDPSLLGISSGYISYKDIEARRIIFCEGFRAMTDNPWFREIPFACTKGQVLHVQLDWSGKYIINRGVFILPQKNNTFKLGATYTWKDYTETINEEASAELLSRVKTYLDTPVSVLEARAGIRPNIRDRRPVIGLHKEHTELAIFNGLGSKGVMFAPLLAEQFADYLEAKADLFPEVRLSRFQA